ncbi:hypothetical protein K0O62_11930 [Mycolicibacterium diernhoferi]|uniref:Lipoprotein LppU n=1 Tax=Mycolicibacterium diernhoferi TaxID=1801 RepID=A0A1Q4HAM3_9MYCO|nr:hypothetical protein [Mycolicibacterium diernhoferi]OJZ64570.1 hypothetical protein BRW64_16765 [Mycolicibacterium diernhoferi]OPE50946.1 hypothetical protein BV510_20255 [Mycolicibacterium diernhoferi]PEG51809.1 hypothetical protein CRI78_24615 [Mycolicibacterium diernhoferi]QYL25521.1 hypothetical protein K0O62_11930 [Mycolicibacterium diernhoferi]
MVLTGGLTGCSSAAAAAFQVGDCLKVVGTVDRPDAVKAACGSPDSTFKVVATVADSGECPSDVDSYYATHNAFSDTSTTVCMDVDWVLGQCMSVDPDNGRDPVRVDCRDDAQPNRQRATQILQGITDADQCRSGMGYPYDERGFTVCVDGVD